MNIKTLICLAAAAGLYTGAASAAENTVLLTHGADRSGNVIAGLDLQTTGEASAFQFAIELPEGASNVNTANCLKGLPSTHTGMCGSKNGRVAVVVYSASNDVLPAGMLSLGEISFDAPKRGDISLDKIVLAGPKGSLQAKGRVESLDRPQPGRGRNAVE